ncbi:polysaccharide biosynthesis C-terminal domain-containing protein [Lewinella sp. IMCC34183]|uniref:polysaccharide biosynthesis C-terminal domain-containing protein n=1 Tax=Lewinella sp. IMCC34183 TaxID=2248762 RepID=UPI000E22DC34|nr:polysaccharide biosynthesis C-terminal domain-containing protein [Lewinella sp. IMCC34183]
MTANGLVRAGQFNQAARQGAYILIALLLPRLGVSRAAIGEWETLLFVGFVLGFGWTTGLLQGFLVHAGRLGEGAAPVFARRAVAVTGGLSAGLLLLAALLHDPLFRLLQLTGPPPGWYYFFVLLLARWPSFCFEQGLVLEGAVRLLITYAVVNAAGLVASFLLPLYLGHDLSVALRCLAGFAGAKALLVLVWTRFRAKAPVTDPPAAFGTDMRDWLRESRPLVAYAAVAALVGAVDPWIVNYWSGGDEEVFAVFRYGVRELPLLAALISGMTVVAIPLIARDKGKGLKLLREQSRLLFHGIFLLSLLMMLTAHLWWTWVFTPLFAESLPVFRTFLLVVGCRLVFAMTVLTALKLTRRIYLLGVLELVVNVVLSLLLAPRYGLLGIIWATVIASYFHELCLVLYLRYRTGITWRGYADLRWYALYAASLFLAYWWV